MSALDAFRARAAGQTHERWATPLDLGLALDPARTVETPALRMIAERLVDVADTPDGRLVLSTPPQEGKSQLCSRRTPLWLLLRDPELRIGVASYEAGVARRWGRAIRDDIGAHPEFGLSVRGDVAAQHEWQLAGHEGGVYTVGVGGPLSGRAIDVLIIDDPIKDREQADSQVYRQRCWDWWTDVASTRLAPGAPVIVIMTRWHEDDLAGRLLAAPDGHVWSVLNVPAEADHDVAAGEVDPLGRAPGEFLESARRRTVAQWEAIKVRAGSRAWASLYQGRPAPAEGAILQRSWWREYTAPQWVEDGGVRRAPGMSDVLLSVDAAFRETATSDFVVMQVWGRRGSDAYLLDQVRARMGFTETTRRLERLAARWPQASAKLIEAKANGDAILDALRGKLSGLVPVDPHESKVARVEAVSPFVEAGNVWLPSPALAPWVGDLIEEAAAFPNGAHDDQVDALSQALKRLLLDRSATMSYLRQLATDCPQCGAMFRVDEGWCRACDYVDPERRINVSGVPAAVDVAPVEVEVPALNRALGSDRGGV